MRTQAIILALATVLICPFASAQWVQTTGPYGGSVYAFTTSGANVIAGTNCGVFLSTDGGTSWSAVGLAGSVIHGLAISGTNLYAGTAEGGVWRRPLPEMVAVNETPSRLPTPYALEQNYPNPFNPSTTIEYTVGGIRSQASGVSNVRLAIYDLLGREVAVLVNEKQPAGSYKVTFDAGRLASGTYIYRIIAGQFVRSREMVLVK
jgi:hypothetical protein